MALATTRSKINTTGCSYFATRRSPHYTFTTACLRCFSSSTSWAFV